MTKEISPSLSIPTAPHCCCLFLATFNENGKAFKGGEGVSLDRSKETGLQ
jgi:hypothetical protein